MEGAITDALRLLLATEDERDGDAEADAEGLLSFWLLPMLP